MSASSCLLQLCLLIPNSPNQYRFTRLQRRALLRHPSLARAALLNTNIPLRRIISGSGSRAKAQYQVLGGEMTWEGRGGDYEGDTHLSSGSVTAALRICMLI